MVDTFPCVHGGNATEKNVMLFVKGGELTMNIADRIQYLRKQKRILSGGTC